MLRASWIIGYLLTISAVHPLSESTPAVLILRKRKSVVSTQPRLLRRFSKPSHGLVFSDIVGLENLGNTCYINAALQILMNSSPVRSVLLRAIWNMPKGIPAHDLSTSLVKLARDYSSNQETALKPTEILEHLIASRPDSFRRGRMGDSHEALSAMIDALSQSQAPLNQVSDMFSVVMHTQKSCACCRSDPDPPRSERMQELPIPVPSSGKFQLAEEVAKLIHQEEIITEVQCDRSSTRSDALFIREVVFPSPLLLLVLSRYDIHGNKLNSLVEYSKRLNLPETSFDLIGVIHHVGERPGSGHYYSDVFDPITGIGCSIDDYIIRKLEEVDFYQSDTAYVLLYQKSPIS